MAVWQYQPDSGVGWYTIRFDIAATVYAHLGMKVRLTTDPATIRNCWHCGRVMEAGPVDEKGREWCGCERGEATTSPGGPTTVATAKNNKAKGKL